MKPPEIKRLPIIQYHDLVIDPHCRTIGRRNHPIPKGIQCTPALGSLSRLGSYPNPDLYINMA